MKKFFGILALAAFAALIPQHAYALSAVAQQIQGEVLVAKASAPENWQPITQDTALQSGDSIKTRQGTCALVYSDQAIFNMEANTTLTVSEKSDAIDINLLLGKIKGKVDHQKAEQPFAVTTPAAVATVRGTEVDFGFNDQGQLTVDLHNGKIQVVNDAAEMKLDLDGKKSITVFFDKDANIIRVKNECGSEGTISFNVLGTDYSENPCEEKEVDLSTAEKGTDVPETFAASTEQENPDTGREPITDTTA